MGCPLAAVRAFGRPVVDRAFVSTCSILERIDPVTIMARTKAGESQRFEGSYTMRRVVVDGAPADERRWHIHRANVSRQR